MSLTDIFHADSISRFWSCVFVVSRHTENVQKKRKKPWWCHSWGMCCIVYVINYNYIYAFLFFFPLVWYSF